MASVLIFDGDDTLWSTEHLYDRARRSAREIVESEGLDGAKWEAAERAVDVQNVARFGMSSERFPTSCVEALDHVVPGGRGSVAPVLRARVWEAAAQVFTAPAPLVIAAHEVLLRLAPSHTLVLLTKGDVRVQEDRVTSSGLAPLFDRVEIVAEKSASTFRELAGALGVEPRCCVSIGNSLTSDIRPAVDAGMRAIWIDAHVWEYERTRFAHTDLPPGVVVADSLLEVPGTLEQLALSR
jgi:putative hydrolase of the HAD superfamily